MGMNYEMEDEYTSEHLFDQEYAHVVVALMFGTFCMGVVVGLLI